MSKPHSEPWREAVLVVGRALDTAHPITGEDHDMVGQSTEALDVLVRQVEGLEEQLEAIQQECDELRLMLDAVLPEKTTFHVVPREEL